MEKAKARFDFIDIAKGIGIILVVLGHAIRDEMRVDMFAYDYIYKICYIFHMSFFFFLSGYTYKLSKNKYGAGVGQIVKRSKSMLLPWVLYSAFIYVIFEIAINFPLTSGILKGAGYENISVGSYLVTILQANNPWAYHLWFIYVLFIISVIVILCDMAFKDKSKYVLCSLSVVCLVLIGAVSFSGLGKWWGLCSYIVRYIPFFTLGYMLDVKKIASEKWKIWQYIPAILGVAYIFIRAIFFAGDNGNSIKGETQLIRTVVLYLAYTLLPFVMFMLCKLSFALSKYENNFIVKYTKLFGKESFYIYLWHQPFCCAFLGLVLYNKMGLPAIVSVIISSVLSFVVPFVVLWAKNKALDIFKKKV